MYIIVCIHIRRVFHVSSWSWCRHHHQQLLRFVEQAQTFFHSTTEIGTDAAFRSTAKIDNPPSEISAQQRASFTPFVVPAMDPDRIHAYLQVACAALGFDIGEVWWTSNEDGTSTVAAIGTSTIPWSNFQSNVGRCHVMGQI
jgi:hypothetical protein